MGSGQRHRLDLCPIHYVATQRRGASRRKRGGGGRRRRRGPFPHPRGDRSRCLHLPLPATCLPCNEPMFAGHLLPYATVTARRYINDRRTADADKPRSGPLCHGERDRASRGNGCFRIFGSNHAGLGSEEGSFFRGILLRFLSFFLMGWMHPSLS